MNDGRLIHIHEDDWRMRCLHPPAARDEVRADMVAEIAASARNRDPSGHGWTDMHITATPAVDSRDLVDLASPRAAMSAIWFECATSDPPRRDRVLRALQAVDALTPCLLVDHWLDVEGAIGDDRFLQNYAGLLARPVRTDHERRRPTFIRLAETVSGRMRDPTERTVRPEAALSRHRSPFPRLQRPIRLHVAASRERRERQ